MWFRWKECLQENLENTFELLPFYVYCNRIWVLQSEFINIQQLCLFFCLYSFSFHVVPVCKLRISFSILTHLMSILKKLMCLHKHNATFRLCKSCATRVTYIQWSIGNHKVGSDKILNVMKKTCDNAKIKMIFWHVSKF